MRKVALYALIMLGFIGVIALLPGQATIRANLLKRAFSALPPGTTITYDTAHGNAWTGVRLTGVNVVSEQLGTLHATEVAVSYYLPAVLGGELPLTIHATDVQGNVALQSGLPPVNAGGPNIAVLLQDVQIDGIDLTVNGVPFALAALEVRDVQIEQPNPRTLALAGEIASEFGAVRTTAQLDLPSGVLSGDIVHADLGFVRTWWPLLTAGSGHGSFRVDGPDITASLFVTGAQLDIIDLGLENVAGVVTFDYPVLDFAVETELLGGSAEVTGTVDFAQSYFHVAGPAVAPLQNLANWIGRTALPSGIPADLSGNAAVDVVVDGWNTVQVEATGEANGALLGYPLELSDVAFTYYHNGRMRLAANTLLAGDPVDVQIVPQPNGSVLSVNAPVLSLFSTHDASLTLQSLLDAGTINAAASLNVPLAGELMHIEADFDAVPGAYSLFTTSTLGAEQVATGAFAIDGVGELAGQISLAVPAFAGQAPIVATGSVHGSLAAATILLKTESPERLLVPAFGTEIDALDLRGHLEATVDPAGFHNITGQLGGLTVQRGHYAFGTGGNITITGAAEPVVGGYSAPVRITELELSASPGFGFAGYVGIDLPELPSAAELHVQGSNGEFRLTTADGALNATYGERGLRLDGTAVPVQFAGAEFYATVSVRERPEGYFAELTLPAGSQYGGVSLRNQLHLTGTINPANPEAVQLAGSSGGVPLRASWHSGTVVLEVVEQQPFQVEVAGTTITATGTTDAQLFDTLFCLQLCSSELGFAGAIKANLHIDAAEWRYEGEFSFTPVGLPLVLTATATPAGGLSLLISSDVIPSLSVRSAVPPGTPPADVLNAALEALTLDAFGIVRGTGSTSEQTIGIRGQIDAISVAGAEVPELAWSVQWDTTLNTGTVSLPNGRFTVHPTSEGIMVHGTAELPVQAGGIPFLVNIRVPQAVVHSAEQLPLHAQITTADGAELLQLTGTVADLTGTIGMSLNELGALLGTEALQGVQIDGDEHLRGNIHVKPLEKFASAYVASGTVTAEATVENGVPEFVIAAEHAEIAIPGAPPLILAGRIDQTTDVAATVSWANEQLAATAHVRYENDTIIAEVPAPELFGTDIQVHGAATMALDLRTQQLTSSGGFNVQLGNETIGVVLQTPTGNIADLGVQAHWNDMQASWHLAEPTLVQVESPDIAVQAEIGATTTVVGTVFGQAIEAAVQYSPDLTATITTSAVPGVITATYTDTLMIELSGSTAVAVRATPSSAGWDIEITALGEVLQGKFDPVENTITVHHNFGTASLNLATGSWLAQLHATFPAAEVHLSATGTWLAGHIEGTVNAGGYPAAVRGTITNDAVTLIAESGDVLGSTVLATYKYALGTPLHRSRVNVLVRGALRGGGTVTLHNDVPTVRASFISHLLPQSQVNVVGTLASDLTVVATGSGNVRGRLLYQNGTLTGSAKLHHEVGDVDLSVVQNELHITGTTPYIPGGSLFSIVPLTNITGPLVLDGLGTIRGEVLVDLAAQELVLRNIAIEQDAFSVQVNQVLPFGGPYELAGEIHIDPLNAPVPVRASLVHNELHISARGTTGQVWAHIPTASGALTAITIQFDQFALPLAGADTVPLTGKATLQLGATVQLNVQQMATTNLDLVGPAGLLPELGLALAPNGTISALVAGYEFALEINENAFTVTERTTGGQIRATTETTAAGTKIVVTSAHLQTLLNELNVPIRGSDIQLEAVIADDAVAGTVALHDIQLDAGLVRAPHITLELPPTAPANLANAAVQLATELVIGTGAPLELMGNVFINSGEPTIDLISSTGQQLSGSIWPLDVEVTSVGAVHGSAHIGINDAEITELLIELDRARVLLDGYVRLGDYPDIQLLGQVAYRDEANEYPALIFDVRGSNGTYTAEFGNTDSGITAHIALSETWEPSARVQIKQFTVPIPELANIPVSGEVLYSANTISGALDARIGTGSVRVNGSVSTADLGGILTGRSASAAEMIVHQVPINAVPYMPDLANIEGAFSGTMFLRGGTLNGQLIIPNLVLGGEPIYSELQIHGAHGRVDATVHALGSTISASYEDAIIRASAHLEQFPLHEITAAVADVRSHEIYATGFARIEYPVGNPAGSYARVATEAVTITNEEGVRGSVEISAVLENERIEVHTFEVTGLGSWHGSGVLSENELDFSLDVADADLGGLLALVPALRPLNPGIEGSFTAQASGSVTEPSISFNAPQLLLSIAGSQYEAEGTTLNITPSGLRFSSELFGSVPLSGRLAVTGTGKVGAGLFDLTEVELALAGDLAVPTVGIIDDITGTITAETGKAPNIDVHGYLGSRLDVAGTLAPLDVQISGQDLRLSLPVLMVQDTRLQPNVRVFTNSGGLAISGTIQADFLTLDPGLRAKQLQATSESEAQNPLANIRTAGLRLVVPQRLSFVNSLATIEGAADITLHGPLSALEVEGSATALRGAIRFSGRDFELVETAVTFARTAGIYPHVRIVARTHIDKSRITSARSDIAFTAPLGGPTFAIDLVIAGDVTPAPLEAGGFTFDIVPQLTSDAVLEITSETGARTTHTFSNDELLTLAVLGRLDLASSVAGSGNLGSVLAQGVIDSALDVLIVSELERVLKAELGIDLLELRTSSLSTLTSAGAEPFGVSLKVGGYLDDGLFATYQISTLDRGNYGPVLMNQVGLQYDVGPVVFDVAARVYSPNNITLFETVPELGLSVRYDISKQLSATGAIDLSADRFAVRFGTTFVW